MPKDKKEFDYFDNKNKTTKDSFIFGFVLLVIVGICYVVYRYVILKIF